MAVDISENSITVAQLDTVNDKPKLISLGVMPLEEGSVVRGAIAKPSNIINALSLLLKTEKIKCRHAITSVCDPIIRKIEVPMVPEKELQKKIYELAEQYIPFDINKMLIEYKINEKVTIENNKESLSIKKYFAKEAMLEVLLFAISKEMVNERLDILNEAGLNTVIVDIDIIASINALKLNSILPEKGLVALLDLTNSVSRINVISNGNILFFKGTPVVTDFQSDRSKPLPNSLALLYKEIKNNGSNRNLVEPSVFQKDVSDTQLIDEELEENLLVDEVLEEMQTIFTLIDQNESDKIEHIFIFGDGALIPNLSSKLASQFSVNVVIANPFESISINSKHFNLKILNRLGPLLTTVVGLAARRFDYN